MEDYIKALCEKYKQAVSSFNNWEKEKNKLRDELILVTKGELDAYDVKINKYQPEPTIDWQAVQKHFNIPNEALAQFLVERKMQYRVVCKREIVTKESLISLLWP